MNSKIFRFLAPTIVVLTLCLVFQGHARAYDSICVQVVTYGQNPLTGTWVAFPTPCDVPWGWTSSVTAPEGYSECRFAPVGACVDVAPDLSFTLPCVNYGGTLYRLNFLFAAGTEHPYWQLGSLEERPLSLGASDNGAILALQVGQSFDVTLTENGSTGFQWGIKELNQDVVRFDGKTTDNSACPPGGVGCPSQATFRFTGIQSGAVTLLMHYSQPWSPNSPAQVFRADIVVR